MNKPQDFSGRALSNAPKQDLRTWLAQMEAADELQVVRGANRDEEIGGIVDIYQRKTGNQAGAVRRYSGLSEGPPRPRQSPHLDPPHQDDARHCPMTLPTSILSPTGAVHEGRQDHSAGSSPDRALLENVYTRRRHRPTKIPAPKWHELDGGYYIGTGDMVIMRDPDTGWINYGAYRVQAHDKNIAIGDVLQRQARQHDPAKAITERGQPCPVAVVCGMHPALFMIAGLEIPYGKNEYDAAGGLLGEPVETILGPSHGLADPGAMPRSHSKATSRSTT